MRPGPAPKPSEIKRLAGNPGKRPINEREPEVRAPDRLPNAPRFLSKEAQKEWRRIGRFLLAAGLFAEVDFAALALYCAAWARWIDAESGLESSGGPVLVSAETGNLYRNPWIDISNKAQEQIRRAIAEFGLSPAQRSRVVALPGAGKKTLTELLLMPRREAAGE